MDQLSKATEFCALFYENQPYPIHLFHKGLLYTEVPAAPADFVSMHMPQLQENQMGLTSVIVTEEALILGMVVSPEEDLEIVLGPVALVPKNMNLLEALLRRYPMARAGRNAVDLYIHSISGYAVSIFLNHLSLLNAYVNKERAESYRIPLQENSALRNRINEILANEVSSEYSDESYQNAFLYETSLINAVRSGDVEAVKKHRVMPRNMHIGDFGDTDLRKAKNLFICIVAFMHRACVEAGLDLKTAYILSDNYLRQGEQMRSTVDLPELVETVLVDYATRCRALILAKGLPTDIFLCAQYIRKNLNRPLRLEEIAAYAGFSTSQLTRRFKASLGISPGQYVVRCKLEQAQELLRNTKRSIADISETLCFSSQSYFTNMFKQYCGQTPLAYRQGRNSV